MTSPEQLGLETKKKYPPEIERFVNAFKQELNDAKKITEPAKKQAKIKQIKDLIKQFSDQYKKDDEVKDALTNPQSPHKTKVASLVMHMLEAVKADDPNSLPLDIQKNNPPQKGLLSEIAQISQDYSVDEAVGLFDIVDKAFHQTNYFANNGLKEFSQDFEQLATRNKKAAKKIKEHIYKNLSTLGINKEQADKRFVIPEKTTESPQSRYHTENKLRQLFESKNAGQDKRAHELLESLKSTRDLRRYCAQYYDKNRQVLIDNFTKKNNRAPTQQEEKTIDRQASKETTRQLHETILYIVNKIYEPVLKSDPEGNFRQAAMQGDPTTSPYQLMRTFKEKLMAIDTYARQDTGTEYIADEPQYMKLAQKSKRKYDKQAKKEVEIRGMSTYTEGSFEDVTSNLLNILETEEKTIEIGHNMADGIKRLGENDDILKEIEKYMKAGLDSATLEQLFAIPYGKLISLGINSIQFEMKKLFARRNWKKDPEFLNKLWADYNKIDATAKEKFMQTYAKSYGGKYPDAIVARSFRHAMTVWRGLEIGDASTMSFLDSMGNGKSEGIFANASIYHIYAVMDRFSLQDAFPEMLEANRPVGKIRDGKTHHMAEAQEAQATRALKKIYGYVAHVGTMFEETKDKLLSAIDSIVDARNFYGQAGFGYRASNGGWINSVIYHMINGDGIVIDGKDIGEIVDRKTEQLDLNVSNVFTMGFRLIENIGVGYLKGFTQDYIINNLEENLKDPNGLNRYKEFFTYLHDRYLAQGVGKDGYKPPADPADYWRKIEIILTNQKTTEDEKKTALQAELMKIYSIIVWERMPMEYVFSEKKSTTQNGSTILEEMQEHFMTKEKWELEQFDEAQDDILYVQQIMREEIQSDDTSQKYVIDEKVIQNKLEEKLLPNQQNLTPQEESARKARIQKAISMYSFIRDSVVSRPKESALEQEWKMSSNKKDNQKYQEAQRKITTRLEWYADSWEKDRLPMVPTGDTDYTYLNYTATGEETPGRNWSKLHAESATIQKAWMEFYSVAIKVAEGKSVDPFYEYIQQYYDKIKEEDLDSAHKFVVETTKRLYNMFREDDVEPILLKQVGRVADEAARNPRSFMQRKIIKAPLWQEDEASMILNELYKKGIIVKKGIYGLKKLLKEFGARQLDIFRKQGWVYIIGALGLMGGGILKDAQRYMSLNPNSS